jgi:hypothetical protein
MGFRSKMKVAGPMLLKVWMKNCGIGLKRINKFFMFHLEMVMTKGLNQIVLGMVTDAIENDGWEVFRG